MYQDAGISGETKKQKKVSAKMSLIKNEKFANTTNYFFKKSLMTIKAGALTSSVNILQSSSNLTKAAQIGSLV